VAPLFGQAPVSSASGTVTNSVSGEPVVRAHVTLRSYGGPSQTVYGALADGDGKFSITQVPPGGYNLTVDKVGWVVPATGNTVQVQIGPGDKKEGLRLKLTPGGAIIGRVLDTNGDPLEGINVRVSLNGNGATTDSKGQYRIGGLRPGKYTVLAWDMQSQLPFPPEMRTDGTQEAHHSSTFYPSTLTRKEAARVRVTAGGETSGIDIRMVRTPIVRITGRIVGMPAGVRSPGIQLQSNAGAPSMGGGRAKADGTFELWRPAAGRSRIYANWSGDAGMDQTVPMEIEVGDSNIDNVELKFVPPFDLSGNIVFDDENAKLPDPSRNPPPAGGGGGGQVRQMQGTPSRRPFLQLVEASSGPYGGRTLQLPVNPDGSFTLAKVAAGKYVATTTWGPTYVKSMQLGGQHMDGRALDLTNGTGGNSLSVTVSSQVGSLTGTVRSGTDPAPEAAVLLWADDIPSQRPSVTMAKQDGSYGFPALRPGKYLIAVMAPEDEGGNLWERIPDDFEETVEITVMPGDKLTKDVKVGK
jgi:hypothetical protein